MSPPSGSFVRAIVSARGHPVRSYVKRGGANAMPCLTHVGLFEMLRAMFLARVYVTLKPTVNDPEGLTIRGAVQALGFTSVASVRSGKYMEIRLDAPDRVAAEGQVGEMCRKLLANPVIEEFRFDLEEAPVEA